MTQPIEKEKFLSLVLEHKKIIYKICHSYCKHAEDRKDLVQEIFIQLWRSSGRYDAQYKLSTWIYRIALNVAISFYRSENRRKQSRAYFNEAILEAVVDESPPQELDSQIELLYRFIDRLDNLNKALMLLYLDSHSYQEISEILGITETNVATKISRIKQKLKKLFSQVETE
ncbi:RNA polymerase sigma factor [bacterium]|nr:RNA polymerase sigma factor [bacterium]